MQQCFKSLKKVFFTGKTQKIEWRKQQLSQLVLAFSEMESKLAKALAQDLGIDIVYFV